MRLEEMDEVLEEWKKDGGRKISDVTIFGSIIEICRRLERIAEALEAANDDV